MSNWEKYLRDIYLDPSHPASFSNPQTLYKVAKKEGKYKISHSQIKQEAQGLYAELFSFLCISNVVVIFIIFL